MNIFEEIYGAMERSNKSRQINTSGSVPSSKQEKIRSGQSYLYQKDGMESEVFEITFHDRVYGSALNQALRDAIKRYPYLDTKLLELDGDFYIVQNEVSLVAKKTKKLARLGHISCGYHLVDITYYDNSVYVSWHHALCDGRGIKPFVETLVYYYCKLRYKSDASSEGIRLADSPLLEGETEDPNMKSYSFDESKATVNISRDAYEIPENVVNEHETDYRFEIQVSTPEFIRVCKENHATPVILSSLFISRGIANIYPDFDKPINANIAVDIREALDLPNTFKNCVRSVPLPFEREFLSLSLMEQAKRQRELLNEHRDRDNMRRMANASLGLYEKLDSLPDYKAKQGEMDFFNGMKLNTYIISYLGQMAVNENEKYIEKVGFYNSGTTGLGVSILSCGDRLCFNFKQSFESNIYVKEFLAQLKELGISYQASEAIPFLTPKDAVIKR